MKTVFFGGNQLSVIVLGQLINSKIRPNLIITAPDKPVGKKKIITPPPLKLEAQKLRLNVIQPVSLKEQDVVKKIREISPELGIVAAYGKLIPKQILELFPKGVLNLHPSLLPKYRGPSPIQSAILNDDKETGVTIILLDEKMDHGQILAQETIKLTGEEYFPELYDRLAKVGGKLLSKIMPLWVEKQITPMSQNDSKATICEKLEWSDGEIKLNEPVKKVFARIRALSSEPGTWINLKIKGTKPIYLKIIKAAMLPGEKFQKPEPLGIYEKDKNLVLGCSGGSLLLEQVQPEGRKIMTGKEFLNGYRNKLINNNL